MTTLFGFLMKTCVHPVSTTVTGFGKCNFTALIRASLSRYKFGSTRLTSKSSAPHLSSPNRIPSFCMVITRPSKRCACFSFICAMSTPSRTDVNFQLPIISYPVCAARDGALAAPPITAAIAAARTQCHKVEHRKGDIARLLASSCRIIDIRCKPKWRAFFGTSRYQARRQFPLVPVLYHDRFRNYPGGLREILVIQGAIDSFVRAI